MTTSRELTPFQSFRERLSRDLKDRIAEEIPEEVYNQLIDEALADIKKDLKDQAKIYLEQTLSSQIRQELNNIQWGSHEAMQHIVTTILNEGGVDVLKAACRPIIQSVLESAQRGY